eukprot:Polyplicarium_translucidae@DN2868_c1_g1_i1.p1
MLTVGRKSEKVSVAHSLGPTTPGRSARILQSASGADEVGDRNCIAALGLLGHGMRHGIGTRHGTAPRHWDGLSHASQGDARRRDEFTNEPSGAPLTMPADPPRRAAAADSAQGLDEQVVFRFLPRAPDRRVMHVPQCMHL